MPALVEEYVPVCHSSASQPSAWLRASSLETEEEVGGRCPWEPGREPGVAKGEVVGVAGWEVLYLKQVGSVISPYSCPVLSF